MLTNLLVWSAVASALAVLVWPASAALQLVATTVLCATAIVAALEADRLRRYLWVSAFVAIFVVFNPVMGVELQGRFALVLTIASLAVFVSWVVVLDRAAPTPSAARALHAASAK